MAPGKILATALLAASATAPSSARLSAATANREPASSSSSSSATTTFHPFQDRSSYSNSDFVDDDPPNQSLPTPFEGQHVGVSFADLNGDGAVDLLFAAGRHWVDQSYALINLGPKYSSASTEDDGGGGGEVRVFEGVRFSEALPIGPPGAYYQIDVVPSDDGDDDDGRHRSTVLLVGGTCHVERPNSFGSCEKGENTPARIIEVSMPTGGGGAAAGEGGRQCSIRDPDAKCRLDYEQAWEHPAPRGDRNGGFAAFGGNDDEQLMTIALLGQGGIELFQKYSMTTTTTLFPANLLLRAGYSSVYRHSPPTNTDARSDYARYAGFAAGRSPGLGGVIAAGRRSDYDAPQISEDGTAVIGINELVHREEYGGGGGGDDINAPDGVMQSLFLSSVLPGNVTGEPYPGNPNYSIQSTNYAFADINGDGIPDLLEATFLYKSQRVPGYPLPQRVHFLDEGGGVVDTLVVLEDGEMHDNGGGGGGGDAGNGEEHDDAGRSVTAGQLFSDSPLPDVVFASAEGIVTLFANLGVDKDSGKFRGLEQRHQLSLGGDECQVRDVVVTELVAKQVGSGTCWVGVVCAVTCGVDVLGKNHIFYLEGDGTVCSGDDGGAGGEELLLDEALLERIVV